MTKIKSLYKFILIIVTILIFTGMINVVSYSKEEEKKVLFISSYSSSFPSIPEQIEGIQSVFLEQNIFPDIEFMDTKRLQTSENYSNFYKSLKYKFQHLDQYDLILVGDDNALQFVMDYRDDLFVDIPIIFFAVNSIERAESASNDPLITGVIEELSIKETIDMALDIHPDTRRVVAIVDDSTTGQAGLSAFNTIATLYEGISFEQINSQDYLYSDLEGIFETYASNTVVLYLAMFKDKEGNNNTIYDSAKMLYNISPVPIYLPYSNGVGQGFFGGKVVYHYEQGHLAAQMAVEVLEGKSIQDIPLVRESPNQYFFDYDLMEEYHIDDKLFPKETVWLNKELTFYQMYYGVLWAVVGVFAALLLGILILLFNIRIRKSTEAQLIEANTELTALTEELIAQEEELHNKYDELTISENELQISQERYSLVFEASAEGLWDYDYTTGMTYMSGEWHNDFIDQKKYSNWKEIILEKDKGDYERIILDVCKSLIQKYSCEYRVIDKANKVKWIHEKGIATYNENSDILRIVGSHVDITRRKKQDEKIKELAYFDILTNLPNKVSLYNDAKRGFNNDGSNRKDGAIIFMDVDNFKYVNDTYGHSIGDLVLKEIGVRLIDYVSETIKFYRLGGDEFVITIDSEPRDLIVQQMVSDIQLLMSEPFIIGLYTFNLTISIGIALCPEDGVSIEELLKNADTAMYKAKEQGRNRFQYFEHSMKQEIFDRMQVQNNIRIALKNEEFSLYYQPIVEIESKRVIGYEALIRWFNAEGTYIPPNQFIGVAEQMGSIVPIGYWVFETACRFSKKINKNKEHRIIITINVSSVQLIQKDFVRRIADIIDKTDADPNCIGIEITETALMESFEDNRAKLSVLQKRGFKIYLDDFGTGYSSLNYLRELPFDVIKIDKTFIDDVANVSVDNNLTEDIIMIAHKVGLTVIAEGVEEDEQFIQLQKMNCDRVQGYLFSKPLPEESAFDFKMS